jgi:hypothetical protein
VCTAPTGHWPLPLTGQRTHQPIRSIGPLLQTLQPLLQRLLPAHLPAHCLAHSLAADTATTPASSLASPSRSLPAAGTCSLMLLLSIPMENLVVVFRARAYRIRGVITKSQRVALTPIAFFSMFILHRLLVHTPTQPDLHQTQNVPLTHQHACFFSVSIFILLLPLCFRFTQPLRDFVLSGKPFFGICIGMQCLFEGSEEAFGVPGLGLVPGRVRRFQVDQVSTSTVRWAGCRQGRVRHSAGCWSTCVCHLVIAVRSKKTGLGQHTRSSSHSRLIAHRYFPCRAISLDHSPTHPLTRSLAHSLTHSLAHILHPATHTHVDSSSGLQFPRWGGTESMFASTRLFSSQAPSSDTTLFIRLLL